MKTAPALLLCSTLALALGLHGCTRPNPDFFNASDGGLAVDLASGGDLASTTRDLAAQDDLAPSRDLASTADLAHSQPDLRLPPGDCDSRFGGAPDYLACSSSPLSCRFYLKASTSISCANVCASLAGTACLGGWDVSSVTCNLPSSVSDCNEKHHDQICECAR